MKRIVLDASVAAAWLLPDETPNDFAGRPALVPALWHAEMTNILVQAARRKRIPSRDVARALEALAALPIETDAARPDNARVAALAQAHGLTANDATYLELAERAGLALATQDAALAKAAKALGVAL